MIHLVIKSWQDRWKSTLGWTLVLLLMATMQLSVYPSIAKSSANTQQFLDSLPEAFQKIFRMQDYTSGPGYLSAELFSVVLPMIFIAIATTWGAAASAEEEERGTADLLFALPMTRARLMVAKIISSTAVLVGVGAVLVTAIAMGSRLVDMELSIANLIAATGVLVLLGMVFNGVAMLAGAWSGHKGVANGAAAGVAILTLILYSLSGLVDTFDFTMAINPFDWAVGSNALFDGWPLADTVKLLVVALVLLAAAVRVVDRKDLAS